MTAMPVDDAEFFFDRQIQNEIRDSEMQEVKDQQIGEREFHEYWESERQKYSEKFQRICKLIEGENNEDLSDDEQQELAKFKDENPKQYESLKEFLS